MKPIVFVCCAAWLSGLAHAAPPDPMDPANPAAATPAVPYRSVFADTPTGVEAERADWKKANAEVGQFRRGHIDILKWEAQQEAQRKSVAPDGVKP